MTPHIPEGGGDSQDQAALIDAGGAQRRHREHVGGILAEVVPVEDKHQELRAQQSRQRAVDHQVDHQFVVDPDPPSEPRGDPQARQKRQRHQHPISGQEEIAVLE